MSFATPFNLPSEPTADGGSNKKRKRAAEATASAAAQPGEPSINIEKLLQKFHSLERANSKGADGTVVKKPKPQRKITSEASLAKVLAAKQAASVEDPTKGNGVTKDGKKQPAPGQGEGKRNKRRRKAAEALAAQQAQTSTSASESIPVPSTSAVPDETSVPAPVTEEEEDQEMEETAGIAVPSPVSNPLLTDLQQKMKSKLGGARFRQINEQLVGDAGKVISLS